MIQPQLYVMFPYSKINEDQLNSYWKNVDIKAVKTSLNKGKRDFKDLLNLVSPCAAVLIEEMRESAYLQKKMHFGRTIRLYTPLYISNRCINSCLYCGFRAEQAAKRRTLSLKEIIEEAKIIKDYGIDSLLIVCGEDPESVPLEFLLNTVKKLKEYFSYISIEIYPLDIEGYKSLYTAGVDGLTLYQETYNRQLYEKLHPTGPKHNYTNRIEAIASGGKAGMRVLGIGALLGLYDWRIESAFLAAHAMWLKKYFWKSKIQFSFPRITPIKGNFKPPLPLNESKLEQMMLAFRIVFPESDITVSTRETPEFRNRIGVTCASHLSAASCVVPGGYSKEISDDLGQFMLHDKRSVEDIKSDFEKLDIEVIFKDWDRCIKDKIG